MFNQQAQSKSFFGEQVLKSQKSNYSVYANFNNKKKFKFAIGKLKEADYRTENV